MSEEQSISHGLSIKDFNQLNIPPDHWDGGSSARNAKIDELRKTYASDPFAIEQLDTFDPRSEYSKVMRELLSALHADSQTDVSEITDRLNNLNPLLHLQTLDKKVDL